MSTERSLVYLLRNASVRELSRALERDGFSLVRTTRTGSRFYKHDDGRMTVIHFHYGSDILPRGTLSSVLAATLWTEADARRVGLL